MGAKTMETLAERAAFLRESLQKSQSITDGMVAILGSFDHRLSALETAMRPTQAPIHYSSPQQLYYSIIYTYNNITYECVYIYIDVCDFI